MDKSLLDAAELHSVAAGEGTGEEESFISAAAGSIFKGIPLALGSGIASMYNTGVSLGNAFGADLEKIDYSANLAAFDDDLSMYYQQNKEGIDLGGFLLTAIAPGTAGIKALKMIQGGLLGRNAAAVTGFLKNSQATYESRVFAKLREPSNRIFDKLDKDAILGVIAGVGEQALQGAAFETAVLLSMNQAPLLNKDDESYFTSFARNAHSIPTAALVQGGFGGALGALGFTGRVRAGIKARDKEYLNSINPETVGPQNADPGTKIAMEFAYLADFQEQFALRKAAGNMETTEILNYESGLKRKMEDIRLSLKDFFSGDGTLAEEAWKAINKTENPVDTASLMLAAGRQGKRASLENEPGFGGIVETVMSPDGPLSARHAKNMLAREDKMWPETIDTTRSDFPEKLIEAKVSQDVEGGYEWFRDQNGQAHIIPESKYAKNQLNRAVSRKNPELLVKLSGDEAGRVTETVYPVMGDTGNKVRLNNAGELVSSDAEGVEFLQILPETFNPLENIPFDSSAQFLKAKLLKTLQADKDGVLRIAAGDLPMLERVANTGFEGSVHYGTQDITLSLQQTLLSEKLAMRQKLMAEGHGFDQISRELSVTREFAETGSGEGYALTKLEDHTKPIHVALGFATRLLPDNFYIRGTRELQKRIQLGDQANQKASASVLGADYLLLMDTRGTLLDPTTIPDLNAMFTSSSGNYGSLEAIMQQAQKVTDSVTKTRAKNTFQALEGLQAGIVAKQEALYEFNVLVNKFRSSEHDFYHFEDVDGTALYISKDVKKALERNESAGDSISESISDILEAGRIKGEVLEPKHQEVIDYVAKHSEINSSRVMEKNRIFAAIGSGRNLDPEKIYFPPINTKKYSYVNFVKERMDLGEGQLQDAGVVVAATKEELEAKVNWLRANFGERFEIYSKENIEVHREMTDAYESGAFLGDSLANSSMARKGTLYEFQPRLDAEIFNDFNKWHWNQEQTITRNAVELKYAKEFAELRFMARESEAYAKSKYGAESKKASEGNNPYMRYINQALNVTTFDRYGSLWGTFNQTVEGWASKMFSIWGYATQKAAAGEIDHVTADAMARSYGFEPPYRNVLASIVQPKVENMRALEPTFAKANGAISTVTLGFDFLNSLVNVISFPIMASAEMRSILSSIETHPERVGALQEITSVLIPGSGLKMPTPMKLLTNSISRYIKDDGTLLRQYKEIGAIRDALQLEKDVITASSLTEAAVGSKEGFMTWASELSTKAAHLGKTVTGHNKAEEMVRFFAADMMKQLTEIAQVPLHDVPGYINTFVNRVHGNYLANQRPHLFQGAVGQAISLFQTYQFNLIQNMVRYVETGQTTAAATVLGLQNSIFGMQGNPGFHLLNQAVGSTNTEHIDIMSGTKKLVGDDMYKWIMYGLGSNITGTSLYNRGDINPRYVTIVPTSPEEVPAIAIPAKAISSFVETIAKLAKGGDIANTLLDGVAHSGLNRPIAGLAQLASGVRTTQKGNLLVAYNDLNTFTVAAKLAGGETLNNAAMIDAYYRNLAYKDMDRKKLELLGETVKTRMYRGQMPTEEETLGFMADYAATGGRPSEFNKWMVHLSKTANQSQLNNLKAQLNSPAGRNQAFLMGADAQDFYTNPPSLSEE